MAIKLTRVEEFALIRLNRPKALNALSFALVRDLARAFDDVAASDARAKRRSAPAPTSPSWAGAR
jgi:enoyl-CoA hydratase